MHYTQEQIDRANAVSLEDFLRSQGEELIKSGSSGTVRVRAGSLWIL